MRVCEVEIEMVDNSTYLGSILSRDGGVMEDVRGRIAKASREVHSSKPHPVSVD